MKVPYAVPQSTISRNIRHASAPYAPEQPDLVALKESLCRHIRRHKEHLDHFRAVSNVFRLMPPSKEKKCCMATSLTLHLLRRARPPPLFVFYLLVRAFIKSPPGHLICFATNKFCCQWQKDAARANRSKVFAARAICVPISRAFSCCSWWQNGRF